MTAAYLTRLLPWVVAVAGFCFVRFWPVQPADVPATSSSQGLPPPRASASLSEWAEKLPSSPTPDWRDLWAKHGADELRRESLLDGWSTTDPAGLWQWIVERRDISLLEEAGPGLFAAWARVDAAVAFDATGSIASHHLRDRLRTIVVEAELSRDLASGLALAAKFGPLFTNGHMSRTWMEKDPLAAVQGLTALPGGRNSFRRFYLAAAAELLAKRNPDAFLSWLESSPRSLETLVSGETFAGAPAMDTARAMAAMTAAKPGQERNDALRGVIVNASPQLPADETLRLARQHLTGWDWNSAIAEAARRAAQDDTPKAAALLSAMPASGAVISAAGELATNWSKQDWGAARDWVSSLPDAPTRREAWKRLAATAPAERASDLATVVAQLPVEDLSDDLLLRARNATRAAGPGALASWLGTLPADHAAWLEALRDVE